ncbi:DUF4231 domain-containing protein [Amycolatopsis sp. cg5]|uniref:DUF4231 domain-containing protein n=1 Tax=Amycolatopsis sp. cg5 TaxID=3238802 RepID=UPI003524EF1A
MELPDAALPGLYHGANDLAVAMQRRYTRASSLRLVLLVVAAVTGALTFKTGRGADLAGFATAVALVGAIAVEMWLVKEKPEKTWYDGRVLAESAKTLTWRFAMCAVPFPRDLRREDAERGYVDQLALLLKGAAPTVLQAQPGAALNETVRGLRESSLEERRAVYLRDRIADQSAWYAAKSKMNRERATRWKLTLVVTEAAGVVAALLRAIGVIDVDLAGIVAAMAGAGVAWLSLKKYEYLGQSYAYATNELTIVRDRLTLISAEETWAVEVGEAEEVTSREHVLWRATRAAAAR